MLFTERCTFRSEHPPFVLLRMRLFQHFQNGTESSVGYRFRRLINQFAEVPLSSRCTFVYRLRCVQRPRITCGAWISVNIVPRNISINKSIQMSLFTLMNILMNTLPKLYTPTLMVDYVQAWSFDIIFIRSPSLLMRLPRSASSQAINRIL